MLFIKTKKNYATKAVLATAFYFYKHCILILILPTNCQSYEFFQLKKNIKSLFLPMNNKNKKINIKLIFSTML